MKTKVEKRLEDLANVKSSVSSSSGSRLAWLNGKSPGVIHEMRGPTDTVIALDVSQSGKYAVTGDEDYAVRIWDLEKGTQVRQITTPYYVYALCTLSQRHAI